ncbi:aminoacyl-histidine dipeptidase [Bacteroidota bacterium]
MRELEPKVLWGYFDDILKIPRISKHEDQIRQFLVEFAEAKGLEHKTDKAGNMLIRKKASKGYENREPVILQSHLDMVGEKLTEVEHDFFKDPITAKIVDGWVTANGTTLGADDGIGIAASMALLESDKINHGPLECLFTADEETGMTGAFGLQSGFLEGKILLNLDSEDEGEIFIGCAGGIDTVGRFKARTKRTLRTKVARKVSIDGLKGGHSGDEIHKNHVNSIKLLNRFLWNADRKFPIHIALYEGGKLRNAIPREASAVMVMTKETAELMQIYFDSFKEYIQKEIIAIEPDVSISVEEVELPEYRFTRRFQRDFMNAIYACPHGALTWCDDIPNLVETSTNLAVIRTIKNDVIEVVTSQRSSVESSKRDIADHINALFTLAGAEVIHSDGYPGWKPNRNSVILKASERIYEELFKTKPEVKAIHAGLECGLFLEKYPDLDMISFGPTIKGAHTPEERIEISTVGKFWDFLVKLLESIPELK